MDEHYVDAKHCNVEIIINLSMERNFKVCQTGQKKIHIWLAYSEMAYQKIETMITIFPKVLC